MLLTGLRYRWAVERALSLAIMLSVVLTSARGQSNEYAGTLPEDYLPDLKAILGTALKQSPQMLLHAADIERNAARVYEADSLRWPQLGGNIRYDSNKTATTASASSRDSGIFYSLQANQAVFYWGEIKNRGAAARLEVAASQKDYAEAYRLLAVQIRQAYLGLIVRNAELRYLRFALNQAQTDLAAAQALLSHGDISPTDVAGKQLAVDEATLFLDRKQADFDAERRRLSRLAGITPDVPADQIPSELPAPKYDDKVSQGLLAGFLRDGGRSTFTAQAAELKVKEADLNYRIARVRLLPKFNASFGHTRESSTTATVLSVTQTAITRDTIEVRGDWSIFDGFATKGLKGEAIADRRAWERRHQIVTEEAMDDAQKLQRTVGLDSRALKFADDRFVGAQALLQQAQDDMKKSGTVSKRTVEDARYGLLVSNANVTTARATFLSDWCAYVSLTADDPALENLPPRYVRATR